MSANEQDLSPLALPGAVVLVAALGCSLWSQAPLRSQHPAFQARVLPSGGFSVLAMPDDFLTQ